ncbi:MAG: asparagine synthase-related protein, partial [Planctomycetota bacterium]
GLGYPRYLWDDRAAHLGRLPGFAGVATGLGRCLQVLARTRELGRRMEKLGRTATLDQASRYDQWFAIFSWEHQRSLLRPEIVEQALVPVEGQNVFATLFEEAENAGPMARLQYADLKTFLAENLLLKADKLSMAVSLELRVPFLDHRLVEWMLTLPPSLQMKGGRLKTLLKALCVQEVPRETVFRPKQGFAVPLAHWFQGGLEGVAEEMLSPAVVERRGLLRPQAVQEWITQARLGRTDVGHRLYSLLYLEAWFRVFFP